MSPNRVVAFLTLAFAPLAKRSAPPSSPTMCPGGRVSRASRRSSSRVPSWRWPTAQWLHGWQKYGPAGRARADGRGGRRVPRARRSSRSRRARTWTTKSRTSTSSTTSASSTTSTARSSRRGWTSSTGAALRRRAGPGRELMALQGLDRAVPPPAASQDARRHRRAVVERVHRRPRGDKRLEAHRGPAATFRRGSSASCSPTWGAEHSNPRARRRAMPTAAGARWPRPSATPAKVPLCLDVGAAPGRSEAGDDPSTRAWCATVREDARPAYAPTRPRGGDGRRPKSAPTSSGSPSWVSQTAAKHDPTVPQLPDERMAEAGMRAWQYAGGAFNGKPCTG